MSPSTYNMYANEAYIDHGYNFTLADAVDYAEFIEDWMYLITMCIGLYTWFKMYRQKSTNKSIEVKCKTLSWKGWLFTGSLFIIGVIPKQKIVLMNCQNLIVENQNTSIINLYLKR